jgi:hypothetical protein
MAYLQLSLSPLSTLNPFGADKPPEAGQGPRERPCDNAAAVRGPGWFESSWELGRGLEVREGLPGNLALNEWLTICVAGPQPAPC